MLPDDQKTAAGRRGSRAPVQPVHDDRLAHESTVYGDSGVLEINGKETQASFDRYQPRSEKRGGTSAPSRKKPHTYQVKNRMINWAHLAIVLAVLFILAAGGFYLYLHQTTEGHRLLAKWGRNTTSIAKWEVGEEYLNTGRIDEAIRLFEEAREMDAEEVDVDHLLLLGSAYEAADRVPEAEALYTDLYENVVPTRPEPYANVIRIMLATDRGQAAAELMQTAYAKTGRTTFRTQRQELIPAAPEVNLVAGYYTEEKSIVLSSPEGYDVYYSLNPNAVLPEEGELYRRPILLEEGIHSLHAMTVNGQLKSDILTAEYRIIMPSPGTPGCNLAPGAYKTKQKVKLRVNEANKFDNDITIYYTVDGSNPDADSPMYTGEPIDLPSGSHVKFKAIAVNGFGKVSNMLEVEYKIEAKPYPLNSYTTEDKLNGMSLYYTSRQEFLERAGEGESSEEVDVDGFNLPGIRYNYSWGYAVIARKTNTDFVLTELYFQSPVFSGPRETGIGSSGESIVGKFRDMGQLESPSGNRGLYSNNDGTGKIIMEEDGSKLIRYICKTSDGYYWTLEYDLNKNAVCQSIHWIFSKYQ